MDEILKLINEYRENVLKIDPITEEDFDSCWYDYVHIMQYDRKLKKYKIVDHYELGNAPEIAFRKLCKYEHKPDTYVFFEVSRFESYKPIKEWMKEFLDEHPQFQTDFNLEHEEYLGYDDNYEDEDDDEYEEEELNDE